MKKVKNRFSNKSNLNILLFTIFFIGLFILSSNLFYSTFKENLLSKSSKNLDVNINYLNTYFDKNIEFRKSDVLKDIDKGINFDLFKSIILENNRFIFNKNTLLSNTQNFSDKSWRLAEVTVDYRYGSIRKIENSSLYEFLPSGTFDINLPISIRYQVYKKNQIKNFLTKIDFSNKIINNSIEEDSKSFLDSLIDIEVKNRTHQLKIDGVDVSLVYYDLNEIYLKKELESFVAKLLLYTAIMVLPLMFFISFYHKYIFKNYVTKPINYLNKHIDEILSNKFKNLEKSNFEGTDEIVELTKKVSKMSSKVASLTNELNINKESLELKVSTDTLTGLPNKDIFDFDVKKMFISLTPAYIFVVKINDLSKISSKYDSGYVNNFIENFVNIIKNIVFKYSKSDIKLYRFYGSQFAIVAKNSSLEQVEEMSSKIVETISKRLLVNLDSSYDIVKIGCTAFDLYGTVESVISTANDAYEEANKKGLNNYHVISEDDIARSYELIDGNVKHIVDSAEFNIDFVLDTFLFDDPKKLIMQEVAPQLYDHNGDRLLIGSFVSIAQKLNIIDDFDKLVVKKTINYIKENSINHELAVNLSFSSIISNNFMNWLKSYLEENKEYRNKLVFSITAYSAFLNRSDFVRFVDKVHEMGTKIILKRYKIEEYPLEQLTSLNLDYIRMHKDYTTGFTNDVVKKHKVKNILIFGELNNIEIITDSVSFDLDYNLLDRLGTYATSK